MARGGRFGWFLGLIFGTLFGVLFAPRKGKELRKSMKAERKRGGLGLAPLQDGMRHLGEELVSLAKEFYGSEVIQDIVKRGRTKLKDLQDDFVADVADFHVTRIAPMHRQVKKQMKSHVASGKKAFRDVKKILKKK